MYLVMHPSKFFAPWPLGVMPPKQNLAVLFFVNRTLTIMKDTKYYQAEYEKKTITLVDQKYTKRNGKFERAKVWNLCKRLAEHPQSEPLPEVHKLVKSYTFCLSCKKVVKYSGSSSTLCDHVHSNSCKVDPAAKAKLPKSKRAKKRKPEVIVSLSKKQKLKQVKLNNLGFEIASSFSTIGLKEALCEISYELSLMVLCFYLWVSPELNYKVLQNIFPLGILQLFCLLTPKGSCPLTKILPPNP